MVILGSLQNLKKKFKTNQEIIVREIIKHPKNKTFKPILMLFFDPDPFYHHMHAKVKNMHNLFKFKYYSLLEPNAMSTLMSLNLLIAYSRLIKINKIG